MNKLVYSDNMGEEYHIHLKNGDVGRYVILPGDPGRVEKIAAYLDKAEFVEYNREFKTYNGYLDGELVTVTSTGIGGPSASIAMEELANCGADTFIRVGTCGGMQDDVIGGDVVIASGAVRMEGTSKEIAPIEYPAVPSFDCLNALVLSSEKLKINAHIGVVQCKDAFYGQHRPETFPSGYELLDKWNAWMNMGCLASEMESSALFITAAYRNLRCGACFAVVANQTRAAGNKSNPINYDTDAAIRIAIEAVRILIKKDKHKTSTKKGE